MAKTILKFVKAHGVYNKGEIAGFEDITASKLIKAKIAVTHEPDSDAVAETVDDDGAVSDAKTEVKRKQEVKDKSAGAPPAQGGGK